MPQPVIFLDDGGVMNDNIQRGPQWQRLVGEFFTPLLGGTAEAWSEANYIVANRLLEPVAWQERVQMASNFASFDYAYQLDWLGGMCELVGVPTPPAEECFQLACRATAFVIPRVRAAFPGVADTIRVLYQQGYTLHTASGEPSSDLNGYLQGMGVRDCFGRLYGPDLIEAFKTGPEYYKRIFADLALTPSDALVVDDTPRALDWAMQVGARTVLISKTLPPEMSAAIHIQSFVELPEIIQRLVS